MVQRKQVGRRNLTEPTLPPKLIVEERSVRIQHYYRSGDHGPPHVHVTEDGTRQQNETRIGQNGRPLRNEPPLTVVEEVVVSANRTKIRNAIRKIGRWHWFMVQ